MREWKPKRDRNQLHDSKAKRNKNDTKQLEDQNSKAKSENKSERRRE